jgi:hypothetical protein
MLSLVLHPGSFSFEFEKDVTSAELRRLLRDEVIVRPPAIP